MMWDTLEHDGTRKIIWTYGVDIFGWPTEVQFQNPSRMNVKAVGVILRGVRSGRIWFGKVDQQTRENIAKDCGTILSSQIRNSGRVDMAQRWAPRHLETRTQKKIKRPIKTSLYVLCDD